MRRFWLHIIFSIAILGAISEVFADVKSCERIEYSKGGKIPKVKFNLDKPESFKGAKASEVEKLIPKHWQKGPLRKGEGVRYINPKAKGESIMIEKGWANAKDTIHSGPYLRISKDGKITRIPLEGNPVLK